MKRKILALMLSVVMLGTFVRPVPAADLSGGWTDGGPDSVIEEADSGKPDGLLDFNEEPEREPVAGEDPTFLFEDYTEEDQIFIREEESVPEDTANDPESEEEEPAPEGWIPEEKGNSEGKGNSEEKENSEEEALPEEEGNSEKEGIFQEEALFEENVVSEEDGVFREEYDPFSEEGDLTEEEPPLLTETGNFSCIFDDSAKTLTVKGQGKMPDYAGDPKPWDDYRYTAEKIVIAEGITYIGEAAFYGFSSVRTVVLPDSLQEIGIAGFANCYSLEEMKLPDTLKTIGNYVFQNSSLVSVEIPAGVTEIAPMAFSSCSCLEELTAAAENTQFASVDGVLFSKDRSVLFRYPEGRIAENYVIMEGVKTVGSYAFAGAEVSGITIAGSVMLLKDGAFTRSRITDLTIPDSVTKIEDWICSECGRLRSVRMGAGVTEIPYQAFEYCDSMTEITLGKNLTYIDVGAFRDCTALEQIVIPEGVTELSNGCFSDCTALKKAVFPSSLKTIAYAVFDGCASLTEVVFQEGLELIGAFAFYGTALTEVTLPRSVTCVYQNAFPEDTLVNIQNEYLQDIGGEYRVAARIPADVSYRYSDAFQVLDIVNQERAVQGLEALKMDQELLEGAMLRAAELAVFYSHTRPSGSDCFSVCPDKMMAENIAAGYGSSKSVMEGWMSSPGHRANILTGGYHSIGIGAVVVDGVRYWAQAFAEEEAGAVSSSQYSDHSEVTEIITAQITDEEEVPEFCVRVNTSPDVESEERPEFYVYNTFSTMTIDSSVVVFQSSDESICAFSSQGIMKTGNPGTAKITAQLKDYPFIQAKAKVSVRLPLKKADIAEVGVMQYTGSAITPKPKVSYRGMVLVLGTDYTISYYRNIEAGQASMIFTGKGKCRGTVTKCFTISRQKSIKNCTVKLSADSFVCTGKKITPAVTVMDGNRVLKKGTDYTLAFRGNIDPGTAKVVVSGKGDYSGTLKKAFRIIPGAPALLSARSAGYNAVKLAWKAVPGAKTYSVYYKGGTVKKWKLAKEGVTGTAFTCRKLQTGTKYTFTVKSMSGTIAGRYDTKGLSAVPVPAQVKISGAASVSGGLRITWKKTAGASGYEIQRKDGAKWVTKKTIAKGTVLKFVDKTARKGRSWSYRIRAYRTVNGKKVYGSYSAVKTGKRR